MSDPAWVLFALTTTDEQTHRLYLERAIASFEGAGVEVVFASESLTTLEGRAPAARLVLLKFASTAVAREWYDSDQYREARPLRFASADTAFAMMIDGGVDE